MLHTRWQSMELIVSRDGREIDRVCATDIERLIVVYRDRGDTPGDLAYAVLQTHEHDLLFPPESGIAGRVHFERQLFWTERRCVYWAPLAKDLSSMPVKCDQWYRMSFPLRFIRSAIPPTPTFSQPFSFGTYHEYPGKPLSKNQRWQSPSFQSYGSSCSSVTVCNSAARGFASLNSVRYTGHRVPPAPIRCRQRNASSTM